MAERRVRAEEPFLVQFVLISLGNPAVYLAAMGLGLGTLVKATVDGVSYLHFLAPALLVSTVVSTGASWGTWPIMAGFKWERSYLGASATPVTPAQIADGEALAIALRLVLQGSVFWGLGWLFGAWVSPWSWVTIPVAVLGGLAFFAPLGAFTATLENEGYQFAIIHRMVVMPMFLFAGTFFPLDSMPVYLRWVGWISPMWHGTQVARVVSYGMVEPPLAVLGHLLFLLAATVIGMFYLRRNFHRRLTR